MSMPESGTPTRLVSVQHSSASSTVGGADWRSVEWERLSQDKKEAELHQHQLRLIQEQHKAFVREFKAVRAELAQLKQNQEEHNKVYGLSPGQVTESLEVVSDVLDKHGRELEVLKAAPAQSIAEHEVQNLKSIVANHQAAHTQHAMDLEQLRADFEKQLADSVDKGAREMQALREVQAGQDVEALQQVLEKHSKDLSGVKAVQEKSTKDFSSAKALLSAASEMQERLDYLEKVVGDTTERHNQDWQASRDAHAKHAKELVGIRASFANQSTFDERLAYVERTLADTTDKHVAELEALKAAHARNFSEFARHNKAMEVTAVQHAALREQLDHLERMLGDTSDKHNAEIETIRSSLAAYDVAQGKSVRDMDALKVEMESIRLGHERCDAGLLERVEYVEKLLTDSLEKHAKELQSLREAQAKHATTQGRHGKDLEAADLKQASMEERLENLDRQVGGIADTHMRELHAVKDMQTRQTSAHGRLTHDFEALRAAHNGHAAVADRVDGLERTLYDTSEQHMKELATLRSAHVKLAADFSKQSKEVPAGHSALQQRIEEQEKMLAEASSRLGDDLRLLQDKHAKLCEEATGWKSQQTALPEKLTSMERKLGENADRHAKEMLALREGHDKYKQDLAETLQCMEKVLRETADRQGRELRGLKDTHAKHTKELQDMRESHSQLNSHPDRIEYLEKRVSEAAGEYSREFQALKERLRSMPPPRNESACFTRS